MADRADADERLWAAVLLALVENMPNDVLHDVFANDMTAADAQLVVDGVQYARNLLGRH